MEPAHQILVHHKVLSNTGLDNPRNRYTTLRLAMVGRDLFVFFHIDWASRMEEVARRPKRGRAIAPGGYRVCSR